MTDDPRTDAELVVAYQGGDPGALPVLLERHRRAMSTYAAYLMPRNPSDIDDVVQESWIKVAKYLHTFHADRAFTAWLNTILRNVVYDEARRRGVRNRFMEMVPDYDAVPEEAMHDAHRDPEALYVASEVVDRVQAAIRELPPWQAQAISLAMLAELPHAEVAEILGLTNHRTVKTRVYRARQALAPMLADLTF